MLIASIPQAHQEDLMREMISHPLVAMVRYNTGMDSAYSPKETIAGILKYSRKFKKPLYIDLKGKQLRIEEWATLPFGPIILNHKIKVELPAKVFFRGDDWCELKEVVDGRKIYVDPLPKYPVGRGQAVNIIGKNLEIEGFFTENDYAYIKAGLDEGVERFMLSFADSLGYVRELEKALFDGSSAAARRKNFELVLKIESQKGLDFVKSAKVLRPYILMAARDDLMIQIGGIKMLKAMELIIENDPGAICASRLLLGLEQAGQVTAADISDIKLMQTLGYKRFMFSDGISRNHFEKAIEFWREYISVYPA
ncbi:MAG: hypothetical protein UV01_C0014G0006 [Parcubacteria group bacterium GW2011_GWA2_42_14]|nr:MAG: hypothetical protein UV01_C0014G0006 [Parcubacteria group bacterium GW2011_GWA2_42_14]